MRIDQPVATIHRFVDEARRGDAAALGQLLQLAYDELHTIAGRHLRHERPGHTLQPTALVHEAYLRLVGGNGLSAQSRVHFLRAAALPQREILLAEFQAATTDAPTHGRLLNSLAGSGVLELCRTQARHAVRSELKALERTFPHADLQPLHEFATLVIEDYY